LGAKEVDQTTIHIKPSMKTQKTNTKLELTIEAFSRQLSL